MHSVVCLSKYLNSKCLNNPNIARDVFVTIHPFGKSFGSLEINRRSGQRRFSSVKKCRVAVVGIGGVGKSLAHLLKMFPGGVSELRLCNRSDPTAVVEELSHIPTDVRVYGFEGPKKLADGLRDADVVVVSAGIPRKENTTRDQLFRANAQLCNEIVCCAADNCPGALMAIVSNPVDSLVPVAAEALKRRGSYCASKLFGVCELDAMRSRHFYAEAIGCQSRSTYVPVVGGHSEGTTVPIFSQARPRVCLSDEEAEKLTNKVRDAGKRVVLAKKGTGGSTFSMASAAFSFVNKLCRAINSEPHVITSAYVESTVSEARFFSNQLLLGPDGVEKNFGYGEVTDFERGLIDSAVQALRKNIARGESFAFQECENKNTKNEVE